MENLFSKIVVGAISLCIIGVIGVYGVIIWKEIGKMEEVSEPEEFVSEFSSTATNTTEDVQTPPIKVVEKSEQEIQTEQRNAANYSNVNINKFLYNQLEEPEKYMYNAFEKNKEEMKTGTATINFGNYFSELLNTQNGEATLKQYYQSAVEAYTYDNPDVFYLDPNKMYLNIATTTYSTGRQSFEVYIDNGSGANYLIDEFSSRQQVNEALAQVEQVKNAIVSRRTGNALQDIRMVHDYLIDTIEYDESLSKPNIYNMYGALINRVCVCEGYARSFKYILESMGIPCILVVGTGTNNKGNTERHAWNYVQYNGRWYAVDVTWDDPVVIGNGVVRQEDKVKYFMKSSQEFNQAHSPSNKFSEGGKAFQYPEV